MSFQIKTDCNNCDDVTNHIVHYKKEVLLKNQGDEEKEWWCVTQCAGCNSHHFILRTFLQDPEDENKEGYYDINYPDDPEKYNYISWSDFGELPSMISKLYLEVRNAFDSGSPILSGIGLRTLVEAICKQQNIKGSNLKEEIITLHKNGQISTTELPILDKLRDIGNFSAHEIKSFPMDKLAYALEIVNHILRSIYILPKINKKLKL